ncbi:MAG: hypothetical protein HKN16_02685 [Saprospiraceae bacterium]|nr:hypothetical protein [Saprospiraceae bacterium]
MKTVYSIVAVLSVILFLSCTQKEPTGPVTQATPQELGTGDEKALEVAAKIVEACGGQEAWDNTRYIQWNFLGRRKHVWDKHAGKVRIQGIGNEFDIRLNINQLSGRVNFQGIEYSQPDTLTKYLQMGKNMWINDSYWLVMPFKLRDPGVNLSYLGMASLSGNKDVHKLEVTYNQVGNTPQNKYHLFVDPDNYQILKWEFYQNREDPGVSLTNLWRDYTPYGNIILSGNRGGRYQLSDIKVDDPELANFIDW